MRDTMLNSDPGAAPDDKAVEAIVARGPIGAIWVAGVATALVLLMWLLFYVLVFVPRSGY
jgi:hypothetical protein